MFKPPWWWSGRTFGVETAANYPHSKGLTNHVDGVVVHLAGVLAFHLRLPAYAVGNWRVGWAKPARGCCSSSTKIGNVLRAQEVAGASKLIGRSL